MKQTQFRLRLNLFDAAVLVLALLVGGFLLWRAVKPAPAPQTEEPVDAATAIRYTVRLQRVLPEVSHRLYVGAPLQDNQKNLDMGTVAAMEVMPAEALTFNHETQQFRLVQMPRYEDILLTVDARGSRNEENITLESGYQIRVGATAYVRGQGFVAIGPIVAIERGVEG